MDKAKIAEILEEINKEYKKIFSKAGHSSKLRKLPNSNDAYPLQIGGVECTLWFPKGYINAYEVTVNKYMSNERMIKSLELFFDYLLEIEKTMKIGVISLRFNHRINEIIEDVLKRYNFIESPEMVYEIYPNNLVSYLYDSREGITIQGSPVFREILQFFSELAEENESLVFNRENTEELFACNFYYKGYEGVIEVTWDDGYVIIEKNLEYKSKLKDEADVRTKLEEILEISFEQNRLKLMVEPNRKHFDKRMFDKFQLHTDVSKVIFQYLMDYLDADEIEERIINESIPSSEQGAVKLFNIFDSIFITRSNYSLDVACFPIEQHEQAVSEYKKRALEEVVKAIDDKLSWSFNSEIEKKLN